MRGASVAALRNNHVCHTTSRGEAWHARAATTREGSRVAGAPCPTVLHITLRMRYRRDHKHERIKANIDVIASLRSGVATMVRMGGYVE